MTDEEFESLFQEAELEYKRYQSDEMCGQVASIRNRLDYWLIKVAFESGVEEGKYNR